MAINYTQAFNGGELSANIDGRSDFDVYRVGCKKLDNFVVLQQGGVERRAGTEFVALTGTDGSKPARMIEFDFSSDVFYVIELGTDYAKVHYTSSGTDYVVDVTPTDAINYTEAELRTIQFTRRYDTLVLTCPTKQTMVLERTSISPTFTIKNIVYIYPPLMDKNTTNITINPTAPSDVYTGTTELVANSDIFFSGMEDAHWGIDHIRAGTAKDVVLSKNNAGTETSDWIDVSFSNWSYGDTGNFTGTVLIEKKIAGATEETYVTLGATGGGVERNFAFASEIPEDANTEIRIKFTWASGSFTGTITAENTYHKGLVKITDVYGAGDVPTAVAYSSGSSGGTLTFTFDDNKAPDELENDDFVTIVGVTRDGVAFDLTTKQIKNVDTSANTFEIQGVGSGSYTFALSNASIESTSRVNATVTSMIQGGAADPDATVHWYESAFSTFRGFSPTSEFFENRLWLGGSKDEPADLFGSVFNDIFNFLIGNLSTDAIKRTVDSPEEPKWLEGKRYLFLGTTGTAVSIRSANEDELITQSNITTLVENAYGSAPLQAEIVNDVVVYVQRDRLKLRELIYSQNQDTFLSNDLNVVSSDITESGIQEMFIQKEPNQLIWCIKENGDACLMTYDRGQNIRAWTNITTDGEFFSGAAIHDAGEDIVWVCVKRTTGEDTPVTKYCIEKFHPRKDLNWYVDSGKEITFGALIGEAKEATVNNIVNDDFLKFSITAHGYSDNDLVKLTNFSFSGYNNKTYKVVYIDSGSFFLKDQETDERLAITAFKQDYGAGTLVNELFLRTGSGRITDSNTRYSISIGPYEYKPFTDNGNLRWGVYGSGQLSKKSTSNTTFPWEATYVDVLGTGADDFRFLDGDADTATVQKIASELDGLDHLEGKEVQVIVDDSFDSVQTVTNGKVTPLNSGTNIKAGLPYTSILRPMPIEPSLYNKLSQSRVKAIAKIIVRFFKTKGAAVGEAGKQLTTYSVADTQDPAGEAIEAKNLQQRFFIASDYQREKIIEVRQDLPYPMTVLSIATHINAEGA